MAQLAGLGSARSDAVRPRRPSVFSIVFIPTLACNCECLHCFEHLGQPPDCDWDVVFTRVREMAEEVGCDTLRIYWQGGEVLTMSPDAVLAILDAEQRAFADVPISVERHLQTNLLLYDGPRWKHVLERFELQTVSSSIDYPNLYRVAPGLSGEDYNAAWLEKKEQVEADGFDVSVISVVNEATLETPVQRFYDYYVERGIRSFQLNLPFPGTKGGIEPLQLPRLGRFLVELYHHWIGDDRRSNLSPFKALEERLGGSWAPLVCAWSFSCASSLIAIGPTGDVGQCDCWVSTYRQFDFGSVFTHSARQLLNAPQRQSFKQRGLELAWNSRCGQCRFWSVCHGGCAVRAFTLEGKLNEPDYYCPAYRTLFSEILREQLGVCNPSRDGATEGART